VSGEREPKFVKKREEARDKERNRQNQADSIAALDALKHAYVDAHKDDGRKELWREVREYLTIGLVLITVVLTGLTYCVFYQTMIDARHAADTAHGDAVTAINASSRPWVGMETPTLSIAVGNSATILVPVKNVGHSPALNVRARFWNFRVDGPVGKCPIASQGWPPEGPESSSVLLPDQTVDTTLMVIYYVEQWQFNLFKSGVCAILITGRIDYTDAQKQRHFTTVRATYNPLTSIYEFDPKGNDAK
jgi:hypothetical protein